MKRPIAILVLAAISFLSCLPAQAQTLKTVRDRGVLVCGVNPDLIGFSKPDGKGGWTGFDIDFCKALAAAIFNDPTKVRFVGLSAAARFTALQSKEIDILSRNSTWTMSREASLGLSFPVTTYYDGQGFIVPRASGANSALELGGASACVQTDTTNQLNLTDYFNANKIEHQVQPFTALDDALKAYDAGRCKTFTADVSQLHALRLRLGKPADHVILPEVISKEPLGPAVRNDDMQWFNIVRWTHFAMVNAEELGVSSQTIDEALRSEKPDVKRLVGADEGHGEKLGLTKDWAVRIVRLVGNYGEVFERNVGGKSELSIARGLNDLWTRGGIQYAPPVR
jgi:general L-amino acid transport system substrate-binding protein